MARNPSLQLAALATVAIPGLDVVATRAPQRTTADYRYCGVLDDAGRHWVVQAPLHASAAIALDAESEVLRQLVAAVRDGALPFDVADPAGFAALPEGCVFHPRCKHAQDICRQRKPGMTAVAGEHTVRCFIAEGTISEKAEKE